jgi:hypothetical protein
MLVEKSRQVVSNSPIRRPTEVSTQNLHFQVKCFFLFFKCFFSNLPPTESLSRLRRLKNCLRVFFSSTRKWFANFFSKVYLCKAFRPFCKDSHEGGEKCLNRMHRSKFW